MPKSLQSCGTSLTTSNKQQSTKFARCANSAPALSSGRAEMENVTMSARKKIPTTEDVLKDQQRQADAQRGNTAMVKKTANALTGDASNPWIEISTELDKFLGAPLCKFTKQGEFSISDIETSRMERGASHMRMKSGWVGKSGWMENRSTAASAGSLMASCLRRGANWVTSTSDNGNCRMTARAGILCSSSWRCRSHASMQAAKPTISRPGPRAD